MGTYAQLQRVSRDAEGMCEHTSLITVSPCQPSSGPSVSLFLYVVLIPPILSFLSFYFLSLYHTLISFPLVSPFLLLQRDSRSCSRLVSFLLSLSLPPLIPPPLLPHSQCACEASIFHWPPEASSTDVRV